jgi:hypothetical protein
LKTKWLLGLNGMKRDVLDGRTSPVAFLALGVTSYQPGKASNDVRTGPPCTLVAPCLASFVRVWSA